MHDPNHFQINRRTLLKAAALGCAGLVLPISLPAAPAAASSLAPLMDGLLQEWCEALIKLQVKAPADPTRHGALACPACGFIHGRCGDVAYPFLHMARKTGRQEYVEAALAALEWTKNVDAPDGAWTNEIDPKSWKGITVFGAIALGESLERHGDLLDARVKARWLARLKKAADFLMTFNLETGNINYPITATHALALLGRIFDEPRYTKRGRELAGQVIKMLTQPNRLIYGEGHPFDKSPKGCLPVDLGYNVEESLPALVRYGLLEKDEELLGVVAQSMAAHLEFMLPDGAWDNSWGTRSFKWTYWGSRTSDGCQTAYALLADRNPAFGAAAYRSTQLMKACTRDGLLYGGPHLASHVMKPCVHHTFTHAKALATVLDHRDLARTLDCSGRLPREAAGSVKEFPETATLLAAHGPWRATVTAYDWLYQGNVFHPMGGALSLLWHQRLGPLLAGSLAEYRMVEKNNMQPNPDGQDIPLTPRVELRDGAQWFTNLYDLGATLNHKQEASGVSVSARARLLDKNQAPPSSGGVESELAYRFSEDAAVIGARLLGGGAQGKPALVLPLVSEKSEPVRRVSEKRFEVKKPGGTVVIEASAPITIMETGRDRIFNCVPGFEAIPFEIGFTPEAQGKAECRISMKG